MNKIIEEHINQAQEMGEEFTRKLNDDFTVKETREQYMFFMDHGLMSDMANRVMAFETYLKNNQNTINDIKKLSNRSSEARQARNLMSRCIISKNECKYDEVVESLIKLVDFSRSIKNSYSTAQQMNIEEIAALDLVRTQIDRFNEDTVTQVQEQGSLNLLRFAFELRKIDVENKYT